ncbi:MAG: phosphate propanoyltransferase [Clostridia bacterium]|nr:phosphate propanoyltransferase [Clostridia bacterium]
MNEQKDLKQTIMAMIVDELKNYDIQGVTSSETKYHVPVSISARHLHVSQEDLERLFGSGHKLTIFKQISQLGQFAAEEKVTLKTDKGEIKNVRILGPIRAQTQIELSKSECRQLGLPGIVRNSGDLKGSPGLIIEGPMGSVYLQEGVIIPDRHIHMTPADAVAYGVVHGEKVSLEIDGPKGGRLDEVTIRVSDRYQLDTHIDTDDANAFLIEQGTWAKIVKKGDAYETGNR